MRGDKLIATGYESGVVGREGLATKYQSSLPLTFTSVLLGSSPPPTLSFSPR